MATKHKDLQVSCKLYDPLGFLSPETIREKVLIQELWQRQVERDEPLAKKLIDQWREIAPKTEEATIINLPRFFLLNTGLQSTVLYLHVFADASPKAYGTVSFMTDGIQSSLVWAKSRVALLKKLTLPKLELAALTAARSAQFVSQALKSRYPHLRTRLWSDSEIVLLWLGGSKPSK